MSRQFCKPMCIDPRFVRQFGLREVNGVLVRDEDAEEIKRPAAYLLKDGSPIVYDYANEPTIRAAAETLGTDRSAVAVLPLWGELSMDRPWGTNTRAFARAIEVLDAAESISTVVIPINSPGGHHEGTPEAAARMRRVRDRGRTKLISVVDPLMASAASWLGTAVNEVAMTPSGMSGSIGVITFYADESRWLEEMGIDVTIERKPAKKALYSGVEPLTDEGREFLKKMINDAYAAFVADMALNRGVTKSTVEAKFGQGEVMLPAEALAAGLIDRIATLEEVIDSIGRPGRPSGRRKASADRARAIGLQLGM